jgi:LuxR family maltose regulon positive regulatory protein
VLAQPEAYARKPVQDPLSFQRWMKQLRAALDLTQERLAEEVGCATHTIRTFESGTRRPSRAMAERLAEVLQVPVEHRADFVHLARTPAAHAPAGGITRDTGGQSADGAGAPAADALSSGPPPSGQAVTDGSAAVQFAPLLATKLYVPQPHRDLVSRPRLRARLDRGLAGPVTVIAAPVGFGKTTLLADWLAVARHRPDSPIGRGHVAWLALDAGDSDPVQFLRYFVAALQTVVPEVGRATLALLHSAQAPPIATLLPLLANDLAALSAPFILVLDDYHVIDAPAVHQALTFLIDHLPPQLHLIIVTRVDPPLPVSRLRVRRQLTELRAHDLRFTPEETALFLREVMGLPLSEEDIAALEARTEGWIAGLQLAAISLQDRPPEQISSFIDAFTGSHHFVVDYLVDEVLSRQPTHLQDFLLHTAILDRLSGPLCDAVVRNDSCAGAPAVANEEQVASQAMLEQLERSNLFIIPLDDARHWYRYHHLFAQVVRERLVSSTSPETIARLHRRASGWFETHGLAVEAVQHALAAHDWERAAHLIEQHGQLLMQRGQAHTMLGWLNALPETLVRDRPYLLLFHAVGLFSMNQLEAAERRAQAVEEALLVAPLDDRSRTILGYATGLRGVIARFRGDLARCITLQGQALKILPTTDVPGRVSASVNLAWAFLMSGDVTPANERELATAVAMAREAGEVWLLFYGTIILARFQRRQGRLRQAVATYREVAQVAPDSVGLQISYTSGAYYFGLGDLLREWNDLDAAEDLLAHGRELVRGWLLAEADAVSQGYIALARLQQARGEGNAALATLQEFEKLAHERNFADHLFAYVAAARAHLSLMQGDLQSSVHWANTSDLRLDDQLSCPRGLEYLTLARVRIAQWRRDPSGPLIHDALHLLDRLLESAEAGMRMDSVIEILILRALAFEGYGQHAEALTALERALTLAEPEGYVRIFVDEGAPMAVLLRDAGAHGIRSEYVASLLSHFGLPAHPEPVTPSSGIHRLPDALTERELQVLRLLAAGRSNQEIADELVVAIGTVKRHINSILGKLHAQSRLHAVARARELHLL